MIINVGRTVSIICKAGDTLLRSKISRHIDSRFGLAVDQSAFPLSHVSVMHDVSGFLYSCQNDSDCYQDDHVQQPIVIERGVVALEQLRADHQATDGEHNPHRD